MTGFELVEDSHSDQVWGSLLVVDEVVEVLVAGSHSLQVEGSAGVVVVEAESQALQVWSTSVAETGESDGEKVASRTGVLESSIDPDQLSKSAETEPRRRAVAAAAVAVLMVLDTRPGLYYVYCTLICFRIRIAKGAPAKRVTR